MCHPGSGSHASCLSPPTRSPPAQDKRLKAAEALVKELIARQSEHEAAAAGGAAAASAAAAAVAHSPPADHGQLAKPKRQELALRRCCPLMVCACACFAVVTCMHACVGCHNRCGYRSWGRRALLLLPTHGATLGRFQTKLPRL